AQQGFDVERAADVGDGRKDLGGAGVHRVLVGLAGLGPVLLFVAEDEGEPAVPEDDAATAEELVRDQSVAAAAVVLVESAVHPVIEPGLLVMGDQVRDEGVVGLLARQLDLLDEEVDEFPEESLDLAPATGEHAAGGATGHQVPGVKSHVYGLLTCRERQKGPWTGSLGNRFPWRKLRVVPRGIGRNAW